MTKDELLAYIIRTCKTEWVLDRCIVKFTFASGSVVDESWNRMKASLFREAGLYRVVWQGQSHVARYVEEEDYFKFFDSRYDENDFDWVDNKPISFDDVKDKLDEKDQ